MNLRCKKELGKRNERNELSPRAQTEKEGEKEKYQSKQRDREKEREREEEEIGRR